MQNRCRNVLLWVALAFPPVSCTPAEERIPEIPVSEVDSAGVRVYTLESIPPFDDARYLWNVEVERAVFTGSRVPSEEPLLFNPLGLTRMPDGTLVVLDISDNRVAVVPPDRDTVVTRWGKRGGGPTEISASNPLIWPSPDGSVWLLDPGNKRLSRFSLSGVLIEEEPIEVLGLGGWAVHKPGSWEPFFWRVFFSNENPGFLSDSVLRFDRGLGKAVPIAPMPQRHPFRATTTSQGPLLSPKGTFAPIGSGGVITGRTDAATFRFFSDEGQLVAIINAPMTARQVSEADALAVREEVFASRIETLEQARDVGDEFPIWSLMWPLGDSSFVVDHMNLSTPDGDPPLPTGDHAWRVFSIRGRYEGAISFPHGFGWPFWIEEGRVVGVTRDSLGVATLTSLRISPPNR